LVCEFSGPEAACAQDTDCQGDARCQAGRWAYRVERFYDGDGFGASEGSRFSCRFSPNSVGAWTWSAKFCEGDGVAVDIDAAPCSGHVDGTAGLTECNGSSDCTGTFDVIESSATGRDYRAPAKGWLVNPQTANGGEGSHYLRWSGGGGAWVKSGMSIGEGFLGYEGFDNTAPVQSPAYECVTLKSYAPHVADWNPGDPDWTCGLTADSPGQLQDGCVKSPASEAGRGIIGAINYLSEPVSGVSGINSKYLLLLNAPNGDTADVFPYLNGSDTTENRRHFDVSKLDQWEVVFGHMTRRGVQAHFLLGEIEIDNVFHDFPNTCVAAEGECMAAERKLYYREMVARFGHHPAVQWNIGEENGFSNNARRDMISFVKKLSPYDHPVTIHTKGTYAGIDEVYAQTHDEIALHHDASARESWDSALDMTSLQQAFNSKPADLFVETLGGVTTQGEVRPGWRKQSRSICGPSSAKVCTRTTLASKTSANSVPAMPSFGPASSTPCSTNASSTSSIWSPIRWRGTSATTKRATTCGGWRTVRESTLPTTPIPIPLPSTLRRIRAFRSM
jgi:hypothetical protein